MRQLLKVKLRQTCPMLKPSDDIEAVIQPNGKIKLVPVARGASKGASPIEPKSDKPPPSKEEAQQSISEHTSLRIPSVRSAQ